jgi:hypothetical protein
LTSCPGGLGVAHLSLYEVEVKDKNTKYHYYLYEKGSHGTGSSRARNVILYYIMYIPQGKCYALNSARKTSKYEEN